jgi:hypothetical protein
MTTTREFVRVLSMAGVAGWLWGLAVMDFHLGHDLHAWTELVGGCLLVGALIWVHLYP